MTIHRICQLIIHILIFIYWAFFINNRNNNTNLILILVATIIYLLSL